MSSNLIILLVEDEPNDAALVRLGLERVLPGIDISVVPDGQQAVEYLGGTTLYANRQTYPLPDIVLLDLQLPVMDGFEVLRWVRQQAQFKSLPIIGLTGSLRNDDTILACQAGANLCVIKSQGFRWLAEKVLELTGTAPPAAPLETMIPPAQVELPGSSENAN